jgi:hypothetical protein
MARGVNCGRDRPGIRNRNAPSCGAKVESLEAFDRLKGEFSELIERFKNRFTRERCSWSEAYAQGRVSLVVYFNWPTECLGGRKTIAGRKPNVGGEFSALIFHAHSESMGLVVCRQNQAMLVDTVKLGKFPQPKLTSVVRLYFVNDERGEVGEFRLYRSVMLGLRYYVVPRSADWQGHPFYAGNSDHDVIERGSQIVNGVPDYQRNAGRELCYADNLGALCSGLKSSSMTSCVRSDFKRAPYSSTSLWMWPLAHWAFDLASLKV